MNTAVARWATRLACCMCVLCTFHAQAEPSSPERGRALLLQRQDTGCILCHQIPGLPVGGELGPSLHGLAQRSTPAQARERIADARLFNPQTIMPAYLSTEGLHNVAKPYLGQTVLTPAALDDIVSYLFQPNATAP